MRRALVLLCLVAGPAGAQAPGPAGPLLAPTGSSFQERLTERAPVSGRTLVGLLAATEEVAPNGRGLGNGRLFLSTPMAMDLVCVRATTQDGRYAAENAFGPVADSAGPVGLAWPTAHPAALAGVPWREVAALATVGPCTQRPTVVIPMGIGPARDVPRILLALANTRGAPTWAALRDPEDGGRALQRARCNRIEEGSRVAFDAICPLAIPDSGTGRLELRIEQRSRDGTGFETAERLTLQLGPRTP